LKTEADFAMPVEGAIIFFLFCFVARLLCWPFLIARKLLCTEHKSAYADDLPGNKSWWGNLKGITYWRSIGWGCT